MGLFGRIGGIFQRKRIDSSEALMREVFGYIESKSGVSVTWKTAMEAVTAMACARVIAEGLAQIPCKVFRDTNGSKAPATDLPLYRMLHDSPNDWMTAYELFETMGLHLVFCGGFYASITRVRGRIVELLPWEPQNVTVKRDGWDLSYEVISTDGQRIPVPASDMWHVRGPSWNTWMGLEGVKLAREAIGLAVATEEHGARIFQNGAKIGGVLSTDQMISKEKSREIREAWEEAYGGNDKTGKIAVVWGGLKYSATAMLNDQAQFNETRRFQVEEVCRSMRVMPIMVGYSDKTATYASAEQMFLAHVIHTMGPWYRRIELSAMKYLLTEQERDAGNYVRFVTNALLRGAAKDRADYFSKALGAGGSPAWMTQDEVRDLEELDRMGGSAGKLPIPTNVGGAAAPEGGGGSGTP